MTPAQPGILADLPPLARYLFFSAVPGQDPRYALQRLLDAVDGTQTVLGLGNPSLAALQRSIPGMRAFPQFERAQVNLPSTRDGLLLWLRGTDRGELYHRTRPLETALQTAFSLQRVVDAFQYENGRDLSGFEDGTENPKGSAATDAAVVQGMGPGLDGSSFLAVQQWLHDFNAFDAMGERAQNLSIGRNRRTNEELEDAPASAHVKRTAQESFSPEAFVLRRSMPWAEGERAGLLFAAFGRSLDSFEAQLKRMVGAEDGVVDGLFQFSRPLTGAYFWCPPCQGGRLQLSQVGM